MDVISHEYTRQRKQFGRHPSFSDTEGVIASVREDDKDAAQWIERRVTTVELDCIPEMAEHYVNTNRFVQETQGMSHTQGAWPKEVKTNEFKDKDRYLRRIENAPAYSNAVRRLSHVAEFSIEQNNAIDMYEEYFAEDDFEINSEAPTARTISVFRDPNKIKRAASKLSWHPDGSVKLAVSYSVLQFQKMPDGMPVSSYIWDVNSPNEPDMEIIPQSPLCALVYNPRSPDHLVGGSYNGLIGFWDLRKGSQPLENSAIEHSHHDPVYDVFWVQSRTGNECCSVSTDGQLLWWDIRKLGTGPMDSMTLQQPQQEAGALFGGTAMEYRSDAGATKYLVGTEQGQLVLVDRKAKKDAPSQKSIKSVFGAESGAHHGPIYSVQRHPINTKYFMTVGDWTTRIWMEDLKTPIMTTKYDRTYLTGGCWSPTRSGVFFTTKMDGTLDIWDFFFKQSDPTFSTKVGETGGLTSIKVHKQGQLVALGSEDGTTTVLSLSQGLYEPQSSEKQAIQQMFERETKREKNLELRYNQRKREAKKGASKGNEQRAAKLKEEIDGLVTQSEAAFYETFPKDQPLDADQFKPKVQ
eukprot:TRINITY_DN67063_c2_g1_i1.p1 TRINITY_DN67063_c2_g1~~TRINITY_DN67063_c2_g1_i1.p1  ORF type:complete len:579 (-),score=300.96 TRINITY_DN67063_c2_g1_i1:51-1787(-)